MPSITLSFPTPDGQMSPMAQLMGTYSSLAGAPPGPASNPPPRLVQIQCNVTFPDGRTFPAGPSQVNDVVGPANWQMVIPGLPEGLDAEVTANLLIDNNGADSDGAEDVDIVGPGPIGGIDPLPPP